MVSNPSSSNNGDQAMVGETSTRFNLPPDERETGVFVDINDPPPAYYESTQLPSCDIYIGSLPAYYHSDSLPAYEEVDTVTVPAIV